MTRDEVIKGLEQFIADFKPFAGNNADWKRVKDALALLKQEPKLGRWITYPECLAYEGAYAEDHIVCSECKSVWSIMDNDTETFDCCPHCGAKMEEDRDKG